MNEQNVENINIEKPQILVTPAELKKQIPISEKAKKAVLRGRSAIEDILTRKDHRLFIVVGPCSIHDIGAAREYAESLKALAEKVDDCFEIVMRVYFEKPRTSVGWEGLIYDPHLDGSHRIDQGIRIGRKLMLDIARVGLPIGIEALDLISPQYLQDLVSWTAVGARTTESPTHRKLASGISSAVGFKNNIDGEISVAINAIRAASANHSFISITDDGKVAAFRTEGNPHCHIILRGGKTPNYDARSVKVCGEELQKSGITQNIMIDCSHGNSKKNHLRQLDVLDEVTKQIVGGNRFVTCDHNVFAGPESFGCLFLSQSSNRVYLVSRRLSKQILTF